MHIIMYLYSARVARVYGTDSEAHVFVGGSYYETLAATKKLLDFIATLPDAVIRYVASDMCLWIDSDISFVSIRNARSRARGFFYLSSHPSNIPKNLDPPLNGPIYFIV